jgi:hypothetical protein
MPGTLRSIDKQKLLSWQEYTDNVRASTPVDLAENPKSKRERIARLEEDPEAWFEYYFPKYAFSKPTAWHKAATHRVIKNPEWYEVRMWSRECAKSTRTMMEVLYITLVGHPAPPSAAKTPAKRIRKRNVLLISNSLENAVRLLLPYKANLESNTRLINDYGKQEGIGNWGESEFITKSGIAFRAIGAGQSPRGSRNEEIRPDVILFDDLDTDEDCRNPEIIKKRWKWIEEAAMATRSISRATTIIFCGNRIALDCCVVRACSFADHVDTINIRDENGKSTWPEKNSEEHIDRVLSKLSSFAIQKEYYNNPLSEGTVFKVMAYKPAQPIREYSHLVCYTDPSYKNTEKSDTKATVLVGKWKDEFHVIKAFCAQATIAQMVDWHYQVMDIVGEATCYYYMEEVFMQDLFYAEFNKESIKRGRTVPITGDQRAKPEKFSRIEAMLEPLVRNGKFYLNEAEKNNPHMKTLEEQFISFAPGSRAHDDAPDACEGAVWEINNKEAIKATGYVKAIYRSRSKAKSF